MARLWHPSSRLQTRKKGLYGVILGLYRGIIGIIYGVILGLERGIIGMMEKKMETTRLGLYRVWGLGFRFGL